MSIHFVILLVCIAIVIGFGFGIFIVSILRNKKESVGKLQIIKDDGEDKPYIFLEVSKPDILLYKSRKYVLLKVERLRYSESKNGSKNSTSQK